MSTPSVNVQSQLKANELCFAVFPTKRVTGLAFLQGLQKNGIPVRRIAVQEAKIRGTSGAEKTVPNATFFAVSAKSESLIPKFANLFGVKLYRHTTNAVVEVK